MRHARFLLALCVLSLSFGVQAAKHPVKPASKHSQPASQPDTLKQESHAPYPQVKLATSQGEIVIELYPDKAPKTVENFLHYVASGYYNGTIFHRVINDFLIQGGGFTPKFEAKETFAPIPIESDNGLTNEVGTVAMARGNDPNSATSQFFINLNRNLHLNFYKPESYYYGYCVFGKVIKGLDVAKKIAAIPTDAAGPFTSDVPKETIVIDSVSTVENQEHKAATKPTPKKDVQHG